MRIKELFRSNRWQIDVPPPPKQHDRPDLWETVRDIYFEKQYAEFAAATLTIKVSDNLYFVNFKDAKSDEEQFWYSMCYLKYKSGSYLFNECVDCIIGYAEKYNQHDEVAKLLLSNGVGV